MIKTYNRSFQTKANNNQLYNALILATQKSGATMFKTVKHEFFPHGLTAVVILGESHTALHSFPESCAVWVEIATCSDKIKHELFFDEFSKLIKNA